MGKKGTVCVYLREGATNAKPDYFTSLYLSNGMSPSPLPPPAPQVLLKKKVKDLGAFPSPLLHHSPRS